jgi:hypothetical protein
MYTIEFLIGKLNEKMFIKPVVLSDVSYNKDARYSCVD